MAVSMCSVSREANGGSIATTATPASIRSAFELARSTPLLLPRLVVALGLLARDREQALERAAARHLGFGELLVVIGVERLLGHRLDDVGWNHQHGIAVADHDVAGIDR